MGEIANRLTEDLKTAMRAKDSLALGTLRALKSAIKNAAIEKGGADAELDDNEIVNVIRKQLKQRQDSITQYESAGREDLANQEREEGKLLETYLPTALSTAEVEALVQNVLEETGATSRAEMGRVMKLVQERAAGRADGKVLASEVQKHLS